MPATRSTLDHLECARCCERHDPDRPATLCSCGGILLARYDLDRARATFDRKSLASRRPGLWRYDEVLPVRDADNIVDLGEGSTKLRPLRSARELGFRRVIAKDESLNPTGSFKARGMAVAVSRLKELGVTCALTPTAGNAGLALAAYAAAAGIEARIYAPSDTPAAFLRAYALHGAITVLVDGTISDSGRKAKEELARLKEPYRAEGKKTMGYELWEQMTELPDVIVYPTGGGTGLVGMWKAFDELETMGLLDQRRPRLITVQASGCAPVVDALAAGADTVAPASAPHTFASGLRVPAPYAGPEVLDCVRRSGGTGVTVSDDEIRAATLTIARTDGIAVAPEAAATLAALPRLLERQVIDCDERIVLFLTGGAALYLDVV